MIIFNDVTKDFGIGEPALQDVSFDIDSGEFVLLTGHSGAGKTTVGKLITKEYLPTKGDVQFEDTSIFNIPSSKIHHHRRKIGFVYQDYKLLEDLTVFENIALALQILGKKQNEIEQRIADLLDLIGLTDKAYVFPKQLSGGEAQRVSIARSLSTAPKMIFADEPTGNLDTDTSKSIMELLKKINELGTTIIMATHDQNLLQNTKERILHLEGGKLVEDTKS